MGFFTGMTLAELKSSGTENAEGGNALTPDGVKVRIDNQLDIESLSGERKWQTGFKHYEFVKGPKTKDGSEQPYRAAGVQFGSSVAVKNGYVAAGCPDDTLRSFFYGHGAVYTYDYKGRYIRRYVDGGSLEVNAEIGYGSRVAITDNGELVATMREINTVGKTVMFNYADEFFHEELDGGTYDDVTWNLADGVFRQVISPRRYVNYNIDQAEYKTAGNSQHDTMANPFHTRDNRATSDFNNLARQKHTYTDGLYGETYGHGLAAGCGRVVVTGLMASSAPYPKTWFFDLFDERGMRLRRVQSPKEDERWGSLRNNGVAIGCGRIVIGADVGKDVFVFDIHGNFLFDIPNPDGGSYYWGENVAVGCGRIACTSYPVSSASRTGANEKVHIFDLNGKHLSTINRADAHDGTGHNHASSGTNGLEMSDTATSSGFGHALDIGSGVIVIGAPLYDYSSYSNAGAVFVCDLDGKPIGHWNLYGWGILSPSVPGLDTGKYGLESNLYYGRAVAVNDGVIAVGAPGWTYNNSNIDDHGIVTITHYDHLGLDINVEQFMQGNRQQLAMRQGDMEEHIKQRDLW